MSKSYDLSTSSKWANLADGEHVVKLKSKGSGYGTSSFSNSVTVTKGAAGETWVLNSHLTGNSQSFKNINFQSNGVAYDSIYVTTDDGSVSDVSYGNTSPYRFLSAYNGDSGWANEAYRTITFTTAPTGDLLTWLQANGTKQGGGN